VLLKNELVPKLSNSTTIYAAWIPLAVAFLTLGFRFENRIQRLMSFCLFGISVAWVFIVDLVQLDPAIRVLILLILGITMIAGGYAYVRSANRFVVDENSKED